VHIIVTGNFHERLSSWSSKEGYYSYLIRGHREDAFRLLLEKYSDKMQWPQIGKQIGKKC